MAPSLVTWPTRKIGVPDSLARRIRRAAPSRTWVTLPAAASSPGSETVWIESTTASCGRPASMAAQMASRSISASTRKPGWRAPSRLARMRTCWTDSSAEA